MNEPQNILIIRTDRIGDVVLSLPMAKIIKKYFPACRISFFVRNYTKSLVENHPYIDEILILDEDKGKPSVRTNIERLKNGNFDVVILVYPTFLLSLIVYLSGIKKRIGTGYRWYSFLFTDKVYSHRKYAEKHELEFNVELLKRLNIDEMVTMGAVDYDLQIRAESRSKVEKILTDNLINTGRPIIIVHPGSGGSAVDLPKEKFRELVKKIDGSGKYYIIITGSSDEKELCGYLTVSENVKNFSGMFELADLTALIDRSDIFVANSTGPLHIAVALDKFVLGFYPKITACSAERWGPYSKKSFVFKPNVECSKCTREQCERIDCMSSINTGEVFNKIEQIYDIISRNGEIHAQ